MLKRVLPFFLFICFFQVAQAQEMRFTTKVSATSIALDEGLQVQFMLENARDANNFQPPSFKDFDVVQGPMQMQGTSIINGARSDYVALIYVLQPKHVGSFTLAGATVRVNGNIVHSNPVTIEVVKGNNVASAPSSSQRVGPAGPAGGGENLPDGVLRKGENVDAKLRKNIFVKVVVDKTTLYEGEQLTATYKLYTRLPTSSSVTKVPAFKGFSAKDVELPNPPQASEEVVNGQVYKVFIIRKTLLFPLQSGQLELDPAEVDNQVKLVQLSANGRKRVKDPFEEMFGDAFDDDFFNQQGAEYVTVPYKIQSPPLMITVKPVPANHPDTYTGAVGNFTMDASIDKTALTTDDALNLKVTITGQGNVNLLNAPKINVPTGFERYDPKVTDNIEKNSNPLSGSRTFEFALMPQEVGDHTIPGIDFSYFDPVSNTFKTLHSQPFNIHVTPGKQTKHEKEDFSVGKNELAPIHHTVLHWNKGGRLFFGSGWFWLLLLLPAVPLLWLIFRKRKEDYNVQNASLLKHRYANKVALKRLSLAARYLKEGKSKPFYEETSRAIWGYLSNKLHIPFSDLSKQLVMDKLQQLNSDRTAPLFELLDDCEMALYAPAGGQGRMQQTYQQAIEIISQLEQDLKHQQV
ncbi:Oxygen tolerance [Chitinophaga costaii]|uniref:Oxygen tolerance n=1 Tax=Chitinophaga costaii TaxID=1335309 RepID=A0A1C4AMC5_9BACT|nr:BatD family protein [Chitinophaga costaii]SCB95794.1 Oxygen tolerance [Chitinophaga costaii]